MMRLPFRDVRCVVALAFVVASMVPARGAAAQEDAESPDEMPGLEAPAAEPEKTPDDPLPTEQPPAVDEPAPATPLSPEPSPAEPTPLEPAAPFEEPVAAPAPAPVEPAVAGVRAWIQPTWNRVWILAAASAVPALLLAGLPLIVPLLAAGVTASLMGAQLAASMQRNLVVMNFINVAMPFALFGTLALLPLAALIVPTLYGLARLIAPWVTPLPGDGGFGLRRVRRAVVFNAIDVMMHGVMGATALTGGIVTGTLVVTALSVAAIFTPFSMCLPFCLPIPQVSGPASFGALLGLTGIPAAAALFAAGLLAAGCVVLQPAVPISALVVADLLETRAARGPTPDGPADHDGELDEEGGP